MKQALLSIVGLVVILILAGTVLPDVVTDAASEDYSEPFINTTGAGETSDDVTLSYAHYFEDLTDLSASSNDTGDTPVVLAYDEDTYNVTVSGLQASTTRLLTVAYVREGNQQFTGYSGFLRILPFIFVIGGAVACLWGLVSAWKSRG